MALKIALPNGLTEGHYYGLQHYKVRKFGKGYTAWLAFEDWVIEKFGSSTVIENWNDVRGKAVIEAMKLLPDAVCEGQGALM